MVCGSVASRAVKDVRTGGGRLITARIAAQRDCVLISAYAPHAAATDAAKDEFWTQLAAEIAENQRHSIFLVGGAFNAKLGKRHAGEGRWIGPHTGPHRQEGASQGPDGVENNRERFVTLLQEQDITPLNTCFQQPRWGQTTYREPGAEWATEGHSWMMDYWLIERRWRNMARHAYSDTTTGLPSDHAPVVVELAGSFAAHKEARSVAGKWTWARCRRAGRRLSTHRLEPSAATCRRPRKWSFCRRQRRRYRQCRARRESLGLSRAATLAVIQQREDTLRRDPRADRAAIDKAIKSSARKRNTHWLLECTGVEGTLKELWRAVSNIKRDFAPNYYARHTADGVGIPFREAAQHTAQGLAKAQWGHSVDSLRNHEKRHSVVAEVAQGAFNTDAPRNAEVARAISVLRKGKTPWVDGVQVELLQLLDDGNVEWVAEELCRWWHTKSISRRYT